MHNSGRVSGCPCARIGPATTDFHSASARVGRRQPREADWGLKPASMACVRWGDEGGGGAAMKSFRKPSPLRVIAAEEEKGSPPPFDPFSFFFGVLVNNSVN